MLGDIISDTTLVNRMFKKSYLTSETQNIAHRNSLSSTTPDCLHFGIHA